MFTEARHYTTLKISPAGANSERWLRVWELALFIFGLGLSFGVMLMFAIQPY